MDELNDNERLQLAAEDGDLEKVKRLVDSGADISFADELGMTALHYAAKGEHLPVMRFLIDAGADVNAHDEQRAGETPLGEVAQECSFEVAEILIEAGADPTIPGFMQITALHRAERRKKPEGQRVYQLMLKTSKT